MNKERLLKLVDYLKKNADSIRLHMEYWGKETECGTTLCAAGHACNIPEFRDAGLRLEWSDGTAQIRFGWYSGMEAVAEFFDIDFADAYEIFNPNSYDDWGSEFADGDDDAEENLEVDAHDVISHIHNVIEENEPEEASTHE